MQHVLIFTGGEHPPLSDLYSVLDITKCKQKAPPGTAYDSTLSPVTSYSASVSQYSGTEPLHTGYMAAFPDIIIAADSGLHYARAAGFIPTVIVGDMDSLKSPAVLNEYPAHIIHRFPADKDDTDTVLALKAAYEYMPCFITLCGGDGGRVDHLLAIIRQFSLSLHPDIWLCRSQTVYYLSSETECGFARGCLAIPAEQCANHISVFPVHSTEFSGTTEYCPQSDPHTIIAAAEPFVRADDRVAGSFISHISHRISSKGLCWSLENVAWDSGGFSLSNRITPAYRKKHLPVILTVQQGAFIVIVPTA